jgi:Zn-dependent M16 (insulinase) family peptidase
MIEHLFGYEYHTFLKNLTKTVEKDAEDILARFEKIKSTYFTKERLTLSLTDLNGYDYAKELVKIVKSGGSPSGRSYIKPIAKINEGIAIPTSVSFATRSANTNDIGENLYTGAFSVLQSIATHEILWNEIRLKNGAYDTGFAVKPTGQIISYSYRDPSPSASVDFFGRISDELSAFLNTDPDLLKYIIGVFGASDTVTTPRNDGSIATKRYLAGRTHELIVKRRQECLNATVEELKRLNAIIKEALATSTFTVVGSRDEIEKISGIDRILDI